VRRIPQGRHVISVAVSGVLMLGGPESGIGPSDPP